ncbi:MAG: tetratricopeptide repeat protein [Myxococcaceae bacterium]
MRPSFRGPALFVALALALSGCPKRVGLPTEAMDLAVSEAAGPSPSARALALAGFHGYLVDADPAKAEARFAQALERDSSDPYALYGMVLLARRQGHPERALAAALDLCDRAPSHPLSVAAGRLVFDMAGAALATDELILQRAGGALARGLSGDAAQLLRSALATLHSQRGDTAARSATLAAMGVPQRYTVIGPFSPYHLLSFDEPTPPERTGSLSGPLKGPFGELKPRVLDFPEGRFSLAGEGPRGDGYLVAVDFEVPAPSAYVVRTVTSAAHKVYLDGTLLIERRSFERAESTVSARGAQLEAGKHRLLMRLARDDRSGSVSLGVLRADGAAAELKFHPAEGAAPGWAGVTPIEVERVYPDAADLEAALRDEAGEALSKYLAVRDGMGRDRDGAKRIAARLSTLLSGPAMTSLRADLALGDYTVPTKVARGRATRDLEATLDKDKGDVSALLASAALALEDQRHPEATALVKQARAAHQPAGYPVFMLQARLQLAMGVDAQAEQSALEALQAQPGLCDALVLRYDLAQRRDSVARADELLKATLGCPGALGRRAEHSKGRGDPGGAALLYEQLVARDPSHLNTVSGLAGLYVSLKRYDDAVKLLTGIREKWPRSPAISKRLAEIYDFAGKRELALAAREEALSFDGSDLQLRRIVERAKTGKELLQDEAIDGRAAIAAYEAKATAEEATSVYVLDAAAIRAYPDGSMVDRIHTVQKALDQSGVSEVAEVNVPHGAYVLAVRTLKPDGTVLEPESIEGKDAISLPGVQVGDYVEVEYLQASAGRGPAQPGFTASAFYFQVARQPNHWSVYRVSAPRGSGMRVDAHNLKSLEPKVEGDLEVFFHEERHVAPYIPEPNGPPSPNEYLPFVSVGAGTTGNDGVVAAYADAFLDRGLLTFEVEEFARAATLGKVGREAVHALYSAVMHKLQGRDAGLPVSAGASLSQDRGSRLWALKAGLEAIGIPARIAAVRNFSTDPAPYRFPNEGLLPYLCLRAEVPGGEVWLDPLVRFAPFGELPEQAMGGRDAYLLPEPGRALAKVKTPQRVDRPGKAVRLELALGADGKLTGEGEEIYSGFEAAQLAEALEALSADQRDQALQGALSRYFGGAELSNLKLDVKREVGAPLSVRYSFTAPRFARVEGEGKLVLGPLAFPAYLGRRFVQLGSRRTPLYVDGTEGSLFKATVTLPKGYQLKSPLPEVKTDGVFGRFLHKEKQEGAVLTVEEEYRVAMARVPPSQYEGFAQFAGQVDVVQARDLLVEKK